MNGADSVAELTFNFFSEEGSISLADASYQVRKHGWLSGHWSLNRNGKVHADARKPSAIFRRFEINSDSFAIVLEANFPLTRTYRIFGGKANGSIRPAHPFTRRAVIDADPSVPELILLFAFWLAVLTWRRSARNNGGDGAATT